MTTTEATFNLKLGENDYTCNGVKMKYDYIFASSPCILGNTNQVGLMCIVSFVGDNIIKDDPECLNAFLEVVKEQPELTEKITKDWTWFYDFCNSDWDTSIGLLDNDKELQTRFNNYTPIWWKVVNAIILGKIKKRTYDEWIEKRRDEVSSFLEKKAEEGIAEQLYLVSYNNYKFAYEFCNHLKCYFTGLLIQYSQMGIWEVSGKDPIFKWDYIKKASLIYDKENNFHFVAKASLKVIKPETLISKFPNLPTRM